MASLTEARNAPERQLWDEIHAIHAGMLGLEGSHRHFQPMAPNVDIDTRTIWFFTKADTDLVRAIAPAARRISASPARTTITMPASRAC